MCRAYRGVNLVNGVNSSVEGSYPSTDDIVRSLRAALQGNPLIESVERISQEPVVPPVIAHEGVTVSAKKSGSRRYAIAFLLATAVGIGTIWFANQSYAPEMYGSGGMAPAAEAHAKNQNYAVFDLNLNIRALREEQLRRMTKTPEVILLGASHWQEAHKGLLKGKDFFNAHIHRDYWEDPLGMVELLLRYNRLPKKLIISALQNRIRQGEEELEKNAPALKESDRRTREREILTQKRELKRATQEFREDYNQRRNEELAVLQQVVRKTILEIAKQDKYDLVLHEGAVYASDSIDITEKVLKKLGKP